VRVQADNEGCWSDKKVEYAGGPEDVFEHHTMTCWQQLYLNPPCCHLRQTKQILIGLYIQHSVKQVFFRLEKWFQTFISELFVTVQYSLAYL